MEGLVGFSYNRRSFISRAIRFFRKDFMADAPSHTFFIFGYIADEPMVGEATDPKLRIAPLRKFVENLDKRVELWNIRDIPANVKLAAIQKLLPLIGQDYGYFQLLGFMFITLGKKLGFHMKNPIDKGIVCSEYVFYGLEYMGYKDPELMSMHHQDVAPDTILASFRANPLCELIAMSDFGEKELKWIAK